MDSSLAAPEEAKDTNNSGIRVRRSILELQKWHKDGNTKPLEDLMRAFKGIQDLEPDHPNSFWTIAGYHGQPYRGKGKTDPRYWGGYCHHGNVLFPTWHRAYLLRLEDALRSIKGCGEVTLPYWDETDDYTLDNGIPSVLTDKDFTFSDGTTIPNPLQSYTLQEAISSDFKGEKRFAKPQGYKTVRYPQAGIVGLPKNKEKTDEHNRKYDNHDDNVILLNNNIKGFLNPLPNEKLAQGVLEKFKRCLDAPNYTVFSNKTSSTKWDSDPSLNQNESVVSLEDPHNYLHLAIGGFFNRKADDPGDLQRLKAQQYPFNPIEGATGDMGENDHSAFDPIFYFHHCNIDRMFWLWQARKGQTDSLEIIDKFPGTNSSDGPGPTPDFEFDQPLNIDSPLHPFKLGWDEKARYYTSRDVINIGNQLKYIYSKGSLEDMEMEEEKQKETVHKLVVSGLKRDQIHGSFMVRAFVSAPQGPRTFLGTQPFLSRWDVSTCANCQKHLEAVAVFDLPSNLSSQSGKFEVELDTRENDTQKKLFDFDNVEKNINVKWVN